MSGFKIEGIDELQKQLQQMERAVKELDGTHEVSFSELFTLAFMQKYTQYSTFDELLEAGGFHVETQEDFEAIPDALFDAHIASVTKFNTWEEMLGQATEDYISKKMGF